jgi:hypothetical protein
MEQSDDEYPPNYTDGEEREENEEAWELRKDLYALGLIDHLTLFASYTILFTGDQGERNTLCGQ